MEEAPRHSGVCAGMSVHAHLSLPLQLAVSHLLGKMSDAVMDDIIDRSRRELMHEQRDTSHLCLQTRCNSFWITHPKSIPDSVPGGLECSSMTVHTRKCV